MDNSLVVVECGLLAHICAIILALIQVFAIGNKYEIIIIIDSI